MSVLPKKIGGTEYKSSGCLAQNHIWYLNETLALKDFSKDCEGKGKCKCMPSF